MNENEFKHRCDTQGCPFLGQLTTNNCSCHKSERILMLARIAFLEGVNERLTKLEDKVFPNRHLGQYE